MAKRIIVTGGNGFVGREVARLLYDEHAVCVVDNLRSGPLRFDAGELDKFRFEPVDIIDAARASSARRRGFRSRIRSSTSPRSIIFPNASRTRSWRPRPISRERSICCSRRRAARASCSPAAAPSITPTPSPTMRPRRSSGPATSTASPSCMASIMSSYLAAQRDLSAVVVRLFNVVGPGETNPHLLPEIVAQLKAGPQGPPARQYVAQARLHPRPRRRARLRRGRVAGRYRPLGHA